MSTGPLAVLDACVLANLSLCGTLLRLAEASPLYEPKWPAELMAETVRTLESELGCMGDGPRAIHLAHGKPRE
jgi:hypothetical protein